MKNKVIKYIFFIVLVSLISGCQALENRTGKIMKPAAVKPPAYHHFKDILIPGDFTENRKYSSVTGTESDTTGFLSFYGPVELTSAVNFFNVQMIKDGWALVTMSKTSFSSIIVFNKGRRWGILELSETNFTTDLRIVVSYEITRPSASSLPNFMQPVIIDESDLDEHDDEPKGLIESSGVIEE